MPNRKRPGIDLVALIRVGMFLGGIASRTIGLFGYSDDAWEPLLLVSLAGEATALACWSAPRRRGGSKAA